MTNYVGQTIGQYQLVQLISEGDNVVYKGYQPALNRYVALKILGAAQSSDPAFVQQFQRDMQTISGLSHPNILPLLDYGQHNDQLYLVTPFEEGGTLRQRMTEYQLPRQAQGLITEIAAALEYIHNRGMVHGNIKPGNILLSSQGQPLLTDFGFTQGIDTGIRENPYLSPELVQSGLLDRRSDTYALGVLLYELLTGETPLRDSIVSPRTNHPDLPVAVEQVILKALALEPAHRYQTAAELGQALNVALAQQAPIPSPPVATPVQSYPPPAAESQTVPQQPAPAKNPSRMILLGGIALVLLLGVCFALWFFLGRDDGGGANVVVPTAAPSVPSVTAQADVNIRTGPGEVYDIIGLLAEGQSAEAVGISSDGQWWSIKMPAASTGQGWVSGGFVTTTNTENLPVLNPPPTPTPLSGSPPVAVINAPSAARVGEVITFDAGQSQGENRIVSYAWELGDGTAANAVTIEHVYNNPGEYNVILTITDDQNLAGTSNTLIRITGQEPEPTEEPPAQGQIEGVEWFLDGTLIGTEITALFQDGTVQGSSGCNTYSAPYRLDGNNITIETPTTSSVACDEEVANQENRYLATLATASRFEVSPSTLTIFGDQPLNYSRR